MCSTRGTQSVRSRVNQVSDDVERAPGVRTFRRIGPRGWKIMQQRVQRAGRAPQNRQRLVESKCHVLDRARDDHAAPASAPAMRNQHTGGTTTKTNAACACGGLSTRAA